ncbi:MAG: 2-amino-4-hydroxy-6-hydroxymethyldihydropteridine diphosphokinase [Gammaproteobacteria bacterium]|nr:2-amino-4-hydroxy-6-hydroxymethyldihydropteridine diphosphokinase [Gammaproteobacteria bacterium]
MVAIFISIGTNIEPEAHIRAAIASLRDALGTLQCSPVYRSPAFGFEGADFLNLVVRAQTRHSVEAVRSLLRRIEDDNGRHRDAEKFVSRTLDLDLLLYADRVLNDTSIQIPRPEITAHAFVLKPLMDLAPDLLHPLLKKSMRQLWEEFPQTAQPLQLWEQESD